MLKGVRFISINSKSKTMNAVLNNYFPLELEELNFERRITNLSKDNRKMPEKIASEYIQKMKENRQNYKLLQNLDDSNFKDFQIKEPTNLNAKILEIIYLCELNKCPQAFSIYNEIQAKYPARKFIHIYEHILLKQRLNSTNLVLSKLEKMHYFRLLLSLNSFENIELTPFEYKNKLLCQKWTYYLDPQKYMLKYPSIFIRPNIKEIKLPQNK